MEDYDISQTFKEISESVKRDNVLAARSAEFDFIDTSGKVN